MAKVTNLKKTVGKKLRELLADDLALRNMTTDRGILNWETDDDLQVGDEVFIEDAEGELTPAEDGEYTATDGTVIVVAGGVVTEIREVEVEAPADEAPVEVEESVEPMKALQQAFELTYDEKYQAIAAALSDAGLVDFYIEEASDDYAVIYDYAEHKYIRYTLTWNEDAVSVSEPVEVVKRFVTPEQDAELETLRGEVAELKARSAGVSAHEQYKESETKVSAYARVSKRFR